ncbi:MAG: hypothetical protein E6Q97_00450 [Desulfurellales bacterium]|nr:MAG: hypothetical protein E6Q97_00450 [Desulfurellales bacterium]
MGKRIVIPSNDTIEFSAISNNGDAIIAFKQSGDIFNLVGIFAGEALVFAFHPLQAEGWARHQKPTFKAAVAEAIAVGEQVYYFDNLKDYLIWASQ